jgi:CO dehydrogenase/acetyl-CoA synthase delta subunit
MTGWVDILRKLTAMDVDIYLGGHGDIGAKADVLHEAKMLEDFDRGMRAAVAKGLSREEIVRTVRFTEYQDVRNWYRMNLFVSSYYHLLTTGRPENAYP